jgi:nascent polypeptide-associated complex subunit alpha
LRNGFKDLCCESYLEVCLRKISPREARRLMNRMGVRMEALDGVDKVVIYMVGRELLIEEPSVMVMEVGGQKVFQITGKVSERTVEKAEEILEKPEISEEDAMLLASQTGVSVEEAKKALEESGGNLASALMLLRSRRG